MADTRHTSASSSRPIGVRRNLFHQHLSRRPTTSSTSTSAETLRLDVEANSETSDIVIRDKNGDFEVGDPPIPELDEQEDTGNQEAQEDESTSNFHGFIRFESLQYHRRTAAIGRCGEASSKG
jgi:hypothetical protein